MAESMNKLDLGGVSPTFNTIFLGATRAGAMNGTEVTASAAELNIMDGVTATAAELNARNAAASRRVAVTDAASYAVLAANSGKMHVIPDFGQTTTATLPTAADGLEYTFISKAIAADASNFVIVSPAPFWLGGVAFADTDAGAGADEIHAGVFPNGSSHLTFTIVTPGAGTRIYCLCDGTNWIINGVVYSATVPAFS